MAVWWIGAGVGAACGFAAALVQRRSGAGGPASSEPGAGVRDALAQGLQRAREFIAEQRDHVATAIERGREAYNKAVQDELERAAREETESS